MGLSVSAFLAAARLTAKLLSQRRRGHARRLFVRKRAVVWGSARQCAIDGGGGFEEEFQGYGLAQGEAGGAIYLAHATASQASRDAVARG